MNKHKKELVKILAPQLLELEKIFKPESKSCTFVVGKCCELLVKDEKGNIIMDIEKGVK